MNQITVWHFPGCSKSNEVMRLLAEHDVQPNVCDYLNADVTQAQWRDLVAAAHGAPSSLLRTDDLVMYGLEPADVTTAEQVVAALVKHPKLLARPVVVTAGKAVVTRPPAIVLDLLGLSATN